MEETPQKKKRPDDHEREFSAALPKRDFYWIFSGRDNQCLFYVPTTIHALERYLALNTPPTSTRWCYQPRAEARPIGGASTAYIYERELAEAEQFAHPAVRRTKRHANTRDELIAASLLDRE